MMRRNKEHSSPHIWGILAFSGMLFSCASSLPLYESSPYAFHTVWALRLNEGHKSDLYAIEKIIADIHALLDVDGGHPNNDISRINASHEPVKVRDTLFEALRLAVAYQEETGGYFSPFLGELSALWKAAIESKTLPEESEVLRLRDEALMTSLVFDEANLTITRVGEGKLDLGAFGKGYCQSIIQEYLKEEKLTHYLINGGNSALLLGLTASSKHYQIIPEHLEGESFRTSFSALSASAIHEQSAIIDNNTYSHIVNPLTGSAEAHYDMIILTGDNPTELDVYSTALMSMEEDDIRSVVTEKGFGMVLVKDGEATYVGPGFEE